MKTTYKGLEKVFELKRKGKLERVGKLFSTVNNHYFYDTGTSKVILLDDSAFSFLNKIYEDNSANNLLQIVNEDMIETIDELNKIILDENLFSAPELVSLKPIGYENIVKQELEQNMNQIILELTGKCNLRCGYCIYNEQFDFNRNFNQNRMSQEIAREAIDYLNEHGGEEISVTFYGGEPLLEFDLLKWCIEYAQRTIINKKIHFSFTTNLTLMTRERARFFSTVENISIVCSIDGPEYIHNSYRKKVDGSGSFSDAIDGLRYLVEEFGDRANKISINGVFAPPYTYGKLEDIDSFYGSLEWLPKDIKIDLGYASDYTIDDAEHLDELRKDKKYCTNNGTVNPLGIYEKESFLYGKEKSFLGANIVPELLHIHKRKIFNMPSDAYIFNGCCFPGARRLYVNTYGKFYVCERIGISPEIGDTKTGINWENIDKYYITDYSEALTPFCRTCWAIRLCKRCYARSYKQDGIIGKEKLEVACSGIRNIIESELELYHSILEEQPQKLDILNEMKLY